MSEFGKGSAVDLDCNVNIKVFNKYKNLTRDVWIHNKATVNLVDGILRFMKGDFTKTSYSTARAPEDGSPYLPTQVQFGRIGVKTKNDEVDHLPHFDYINREEFVETVFSTSSLQEPCYSSFEDSDEGLILSYPFDKIRQAGYEDSNNAECLEFYAYISPGSLVGRTLSEVNPDDPSEITKTFKPYSHSYWNPNSGEYEAMITEIALTSDQGALLARVLFDGDVHSEIASDSFGSPLGTYPVPENPDSEFTPIIQSQSSTVVIIWRVGIVSVDRKNTVMTQNDLSMEVFSESLAESLLTDYKIVKVVGTSESEVEFDDFSKDLARKVTEITGGNLSSIT